MSAQPTPGGPCGRENRRWSGDLRQEEAQRGVHRDWPGKGQLRREHLRPAQAQQQRPRGQRVRREVEGLMGRPDPVTDGRRGSDLGCLGWLFVVFRSEEHTSELQSLMRISYAVFCLKKKNKRRTAITRAREIQSK